MVRPALPVVAAAVTVYFVVIALAWARGVRGALATRGRRVQELYAEPLKEELEIEFKLPGVAFPIEAKAAVVSFKESNVIPLAGLKFVDIDTPYLDHINDYIDRRRQTLLAA